MLDLLTHDPATTEFLLTTGLSLALIGSAALTIMSLPWTDQEIADVDRAARKAVAGPARRLVALSRQALARS